MRLPHRPDDGWAGGAAVRAHLSIAVEALGFGAVRAGYRGSRREYTLLDQGGGLAACMLGELATAQSSAASIILEPAMCSPD
jgi:hypothetical protein